MNRLWAFERGQFWAIELAEAELTPVQARIAVEISEFGERDADLIAEAVGETAGEEIRRRFREGGRCFGVRAQGRLAAYGWVSSGAAWIGELERQFRIPSGEVYIWDCATLPEFRRNRLYSALLGAMLARFGIEGVRRAWIGSNQENKPSMRGFVAAGFRPAAQVTYLRLTILRMSRLKPLTGSGPGLVTRLAQALREDGEIALGGWLVGFGRGNKPGGV